MDKITIHSESASEQRIVPYKKRLTMDGNGEGNGTETEEVK